MSKVVETTTVDVTVPISENGRDATWEAALTEAKKIYPDVWLEYLAESQDDGEVRFTMRVGNPRAREVWEQSLAEKVRRYADERRAYGFRAVVNSSRIASDLYQMLGMEWPE